jgi:hypothetical protein
VALTAPSTKDWGKPRERTEYGNVNRDTQQIEFHGRTWRRVWNRRWHARHGTANGFTSSVQVLFTPPHGRASWLQYNSGSVAFNDHRLGACCFSALGPDGLRHRYLSGFDENETDMYFLAQLPDDEEILSYQDAINALKPAIVKQAERQEREIARQGDVFAIATDLNDEQVYDDAVSIGDRTRFLQLVPGRNGGWRLKRGIARNRARSTIGIYGTGHTADEVVIKPSGATYLRGTLYHDPVIEEAGRTTEHRPVSLGTGKSWFLAVRNTVPRDPVSEGGEET